MRRIFIHDGNLRKGPLEQGFPILEEGEGRERMHREYYVHTRGKRFGIFQSHRVEGPHPYAEAFNLFRKRGGEKGVKSVVLAIHIIAWTPRNLPVKHKLIRAYDAIRAQKNAEEREYHASQIQVS